MRLPGTSPRRTAASGRQWGGRGGLVASVGSARRRSGDARRLSWAPWSQGVSQGRGSTLAGALSLSARATGPSGHAAGICSQVRTITSTRAWAWLSSISSPTAAGTCTTKIIRVMVGAAAYLFQPASALYAVAYRPLRREQIEQIEMWPAPAQLLAKPRAAVMAPGATCVCPLTWKRLTRKPAAVCASPEPNRVSSLRRRRLFANRVRRQVRHGTSRLVGSYGQRHIARIIPPEMLASAENGFRKTRTHATTHSIAHDDIERYGECLEPVLVPSRAQRSAKHEVKGKISANRVADQQDHGNHEQRPREGFASS